MGTARGESLTRVTKSYLLANIAPPQLAPDVDPNTRAMRRSGLYLANMHWVGEAIVTHYSLYIPTLSLDVYGMLVVSVLVLARLKFNYYILLYTLLRVEIF